MKKVIVIGIVLVTIEVIAGYFIINSFMQKENDDVQKGLEKTVNNIIQDFQLIQESIKNNIYRDAALFRLQGKLVSPEDYAIYLQENSGILHNIIHSHRWIPRITSSERSEFEQFYRHYYDANFTIRHIRFNPTVQTFDIRPIANKTEYYPFALSEPPFTLTLMGGDFSSPTFQSALTAPERITRTGRIPLQIPNNDIDYGTQIYHTVRTDVPAIVDTMENNPPLVNHSVIVGQIAIMTRLSVLIARAGKFLGIDRTLYDLTIFDSDDLELIYTEQKMGPDISFNDMDKTWIRQDVMYMDKTVRMFFRFSTQYEEQFRDSTDTVVIITYVLLAVILNVASLYIWYSYNRGLEVKASNVYKQLLTYINHELRNPLVPISGLVEMAIDKLESLEDSDDIELIISDLYTVRGHTQLMQYIIDDVLTYRKIKEGKVSVNLADISVREMVRDLNRTVYAKIRENPHVEFIMDVDGSLIVHADQYRLYQIILNFVNNAIKFTDAGYIKLSIQSTGDKCRFEVEDTGCGVSPDMHNRLFNEFSQEGNRHDGYGLGLFISRNLTTLMHGEIGHRNRSETYESGSVFYCVFPRSHASSMV